MTEQWLLEWRPGRHLEVLTGVLWEVLAAWARSAVFDRLISKIKGNGDQTVARAD